MLAGDGPGTWIFLRAVEANIRNSPPRRPLPTADEILRSQTADRLFHSAKSLTDAHLRKAAESVVARRQPRGAVSKTEFSNLAAECFDLARIRMMGGDADRLMNLRKSAARRELIELKEQFHRKQREEQGARAQNSAWLRGLLRKIGLSGRRAGGERQRELGRSRER